MHEPPLDLRGSLSPVLLPSTLPCRLGAITSWRERRAGRISLPKVRTCMDVRLGPRDPEREPAQAKEGRGVSTQREPRSEYERYRAYMRREYGPGPWLPWRCREDDNWLGWCSTYDLDPITGRPKPPPVREDQEAARAAS